MTGAWVKISENQYGSDEIILINSEGVILVYILQFILCIAVC